MHTCVLVCGRANLQQGKWQQNLAKIALPWLKYAISNWWTLNLTHKHGHLDQALLFKGEDMEVLLHRFDVRGMQSGIHNHKASFVSLCLKGSYIESRWSMDCQAAGSYMECHRYMHACKRLQMRLHHPVSPFVCYVWKGRCFPAKADAIDETYKVCLP